MVNAYSKCNTFWTQIFKAYDEFHNKIKLTNAGEVLSDQNQSVSTKGLELGTNFLSINTGLIKVSLVLHTF